MTTSDNTATVLLQRSSAWMCGMRKFNVVIDGQKQGTIGNAQSGRFRLSPGRHRLQVSMDWYKSEPLELELAAGQTLQLECGVKTSLSDSWRSLVAPGTYLYLRRLDGEPPARAVEQGTVTHAPQPAPKPAAAGTVKPRPDVQLFISYRRADSPDVCGRIYDRLVQEFGRESVFKDVDSIPFGVDFREHLDHQVSQCNVLLAVIGDRWLEDKGADGRSRLFDPQDYVRIEIESALRRNIPVVPLLVRGAGMPASSDLPESLQPLLFRNGLSVRPDPDFHNDMSRLIEGLCKTH